MTSEEISKISELKKSIAKEKKILQEIINLTKAISQTKDREEKRIISSQIKNLENSIKKTSKDILETFEEVNISTALKSYIQKENEISGIQPKTTSIKELRILKETKPYIQQIGEPTKLERETIKRIGKIEKKIEKKRLKKPNIYVKISNKFFSKTSKSLINKSAFNVFKREVIKCKLNILPESYISIILLTTLLSIFVGVFIFFFFLFFNLSAELPIITKSTESFLSRFAKIFWVLFLFPIGTFLMMYFYPSLEKKSIESRINQELPFAAIHMAAISGSLLEPSKIFSIIISTKEYPFLEKELTKLMNEINVYGYDLITALRAVAFNSPSEKFAELFNGIATTINSGGNLPGFFERRAETLLFDYKIEREKYTKAAETFMDIYISVVIAAPMILLLLLMMMKISNLGIQLETYAITLIMVLSVSVINVFFIIFLHLKQPSE